MSELVNKDYPENGRPREVLVNEVHASFARAIELFAQGISQKPTAIMDRKGRLVSLDLEVDEDTKTEQIEALRQMVAFIAVESYGRGFEDAQNYVEVEADVEAMK